MRKESIATLVSELSKLKPDVVFAVSGLTFGLCMVFLNAPFEAPDEAAHFFRAYHVSEGNMIPIRHDDITGGWLPSSIARAYLPFENLIGHPENHTAIESVLNQIHEPFDDQKRVFTSMGFAALNSPIVYVPQALGIKVGRLCGLSALGMMYTGRIFNLLAWLIIFTLAIRTTPILKWVFVLLGLLPMNVYLASSLSADALVDSICNLLFALVLGLIAQKERLKLLQMVTIAFLCVMIVYSKLPYVPLTGLILLIPASRFNSFRKKMLFLTVTFGLVFFLFLSWSHTVNMIYPPSLARYVPAHKAWLIAHPLSFPLLAIRSFLTYLSSHVTSFIGNLGFLDTPLPVWIYLSFPIMLIGVSLFEDTQNCVVSLLSRYWAFFLCLCVFFLIEFSQYLVWTPPDSPLIQGVQGRYFLPIAAPMFLAFFYNKRLQLSGRWILPVISGLYCVVVLAVACWTLYGRFYAPLP